MTSYATSEESVQGGARLELYKFHVGATRGTPAVLGSTSNTEVFRDEFEYASTAAMLANYSFNPRNFADATCTLDATGGVGGTKGLRIDIPSGIKSGHSGPLVTRVLSGLTPNAIHDLTIQVKLDVGFGTDAWWGFYEIAGLLTVPNLAGTIYAGFAGYNDPVAISNVFLTATARTKSSSSGTITLEFGFGELSYFTIHHDMHLWWDTLVVSRVDTAITIPAVPADPGDVSNFTSADVDVVYNGDTYSHDIIIRNNLTSGENESSAGSVEVHVPRTSSIATLSAGPPNPPITLEIIRLHRADLTQAVTTWRGQVIRRKFQGPECVLMCAGVVSLLERKIPRRLTQKKLCHNQVYDSLCQVSRAAFTTGALTVSAVSGLTVTITGAAAAAGAWTTKWQNGIVNFGRLRGRIETVTGDIITLRQVLPGLIVGSTVTLTAGCSNTIDDCAQFANTVHFNGERMLPVRNPATGVGLGVSGGGS